MFFVKGVLLAALLTLPAQPAQRSQSAPSQPAQSGAASRSSAAYRGFAAHYRPGLMGRVAHRRGMALVDCMIASPTLPLGTWVQVKSTKYGSTKTCRVTDVAHPRDRARIIRRGIVAELDFQSARRICRISRYGQQPPQACPVIVTILRGK